MSNTLTQSKIDVGLSESATDEIALELNRYLSSLHVLYAKLHNYHWNVEGTNFFTVHATLEEMYDAVAEEIDEIAERVLKIGHRPYARLADYLAHSEIAEVESQAAHDLEIANELRADYAILIKRLRSLISVAQSHGDEGTADDAIGFLKAKEKTVWMLTAFTS